MLCPESVLVTGANRGIGLEFVKQFLALSQPPKHVFAGCRSPDGAKVCHLFYVKSKHHHTITSMQNSSIFKAVILDNFYMTLSS